MSGEVLHEPVDAHGVLHVRLANPGKHNAISIAMWKALRSLFEQLQAQAPEEAPRAVLLSGDGGHFAAGADIEEFPRFRFDEAALRDYHEEVVAPALGALLGCDIPLVARIDGSCVGGGLEVAACCDIRIAAHSARFGIPIAKLGFPMAPGELLALGRVVPAATLRELLLEARLLDSATALTRGLVNRVVEATELAHEAQATAQRIAALSPNAARINKRTLRQIAEAALTPAQRRMHFSYADHPEHREGISAFLDKRPPRFAKP
ncbi:enoyl-CoA hydratase/isomerase family protein [Ideonella sp. BN130291]|uniref:enoyl-CoA hydratase/isomerase family protein n=1 Tax=Ideonella sp. BN130291 TaxID=3112940 RepID=UPI002E261BEE|nr:enoyl-CoA hydratase-related protein [Ideonella sp. BN130291]